MDSPGGRVEFALQLYNLLHLEVEEDEDTNTNAETDGLNRKILSVGLKSFYTKDDAQGPKQQKRARTDDGDDTGGSGDGGGQGTASSAELRAHGYEVQSQVIVDANGGTMEPLFEVRQPSSTHYTPP